MSLILSGTDGLSDVDGTAATPAIRGTDANTGIFFPAADTIAFAEGGAECARFDSSGRLGIGSTNPSEKLTIDTAGTSTTTSILLGARNSGGDSVRLVTTQNSDGTATFDSDAGSNGTAGFIFKNSGSEKARLDSNGSLAIGATTVVTNNGGITATTTSSGSVAATLGMRNAGTANGSGTTLVFRGVSNASAEHDYAYVAGVADDTTAKTGSLRFSTTAGSSPVERARIDSSGNLLVGTTDASGTAGIGFKFLPSATYSRTNQVGSTTSNSDTTHEVYSTGASAYRFYVGYGGTVFATSITISAISDQRLKENVRDIDTGLNSIMALKPRRFDWKEGKGQDKKDVAGFIAQEFETVFPECVSTSKAGADGIEYKNINHETLIPTLVKAMQEQQALITQLTARITALEGA